ncbi:phage terminase large subunit [Microbulbifer sp. OS29]|uniref:Phage terminase large subunit n=1 Tax=Microbulbifer okhotskensis TaxID=2926617 RepID=A0A9X2ENZ2_9GAMM|nr:phage terminase large subunit [Microbulbifer okhotskensis]MCO1335186.1 phage terminase large subunit [Microbulbifer okhotskensis]
MNKLQLAAAIKLVRQEREFLQTVPPRLRELFTAIQRVIILVGGRGSGKSIAGAKFVKKRMDIGQRWMMAREFQNSIDESVHALVKAEVDADPKGLRCDATKVYGSSGEALGIYRGLTRNLESMKSTAGLNGVWVEEAATLSEKSLDLLIPTVREEGSQLLFTLNRGSSADPFAKRFLQPYEKELAKSGRYCDDHLLIIQINYDDNPWFPDVLEKQRQRDFELLPRAKYEHIWSGAYSDTVENAIIEPEWFDACVDAHKKLGFEAVGQERIAYDPADAGDAKALAYVHGSVVLDTRSTQAGDVASATDWALSYTNEKRPDAFIWDVVGIGAGLKGPITQALEGKRIEVEGFNGAATPESPDAIYKPEDGEIKEPKTNRETFANRRAQYYWMLRDRMFKTYLAVNKGKYINPDELLSINPDIEELAQLRAEVCRLPRKYVAGGKIQLLSKPDMKKQGIDSPNMADALMMCMAEVTVDDDDFDYSQSNPGIRY